MAESVTIARPYAKAAFQVAREADAITQWADMLSVAKTVSQDADMQVVFDHPELTAEQKAQLFIDVCGDKLNDQGKNFVGVLAANGRLPLIPHIQELFEVLKAQLEMSVDVDIESAFELDNEHQEKLAAALGKKLDRKVNVSSTTNTSLLGGAIIRAQDLVIDASVRGKILKLAEAINS